MVWDKWLQRLHPVGADLGRDLARSGSNPDAGDFQIKMRQTVYDCCAADREQARLPPKNVGLLDLWYGIPAPSCEPSTAPHQPQPRHNLHLPAPEFNPAPVASGASHDGLQSSPSNPGHTSYHRPALRTPPHRPPPLQSGRFGPMLMYPAETSGQPRLPQTTGPPATCRSKTRVSAISFPLR